MNTYAGQKLMLDLACASCLVGVHMFWTSQMQECNLLYQCLLAGLNGCVSAQAWALTH